MKTIQMTIDEPLLNEVDDLVRDLDTTRSALIREALKRAIRQHKIREMERKHAEGYARHPATLEEIDIWETEQAWGEEWNEEK